MSKRMPRHGKRDANEPEIVAELRAIGAGVIPISKKGVCDLIVGFREVNYLLEVKTATGKLTEAETEFFNTWPGQKAIVRTSDEAKRVIGAID